MKLPYWRLSAFYFFYFATIGTFLPFWSVFLQQSGFTAIEIGELSALLVATKIIAPNFWGWLADKLSWRMLLIRLCASLAAGFFAGFLYLQGYQWYALVTVLFSFFWNASLPQFEAVTLLHLRAHALQVYSQIRLWGSVGFIFAVLGIGWYLEYFSIHYLPHIIISLLLANALIAFITPEPLFSKTAHQANGLWALLLRTEVIGFFLVYMFLQIAHGPYYVFYSVYLNLHGYSSTATGLLWALGVVAEIIMFMLAGGLQARFSLRQLLLASLALSTLRWWLTAYWVDQLYWQLIAQLLHAASFGITHVVAIQLLYHYFGPAHQGKCQALYSSFSFGLGGMIGSLYSGYFWDSLGPSLVFLIAAFASGMAFLIAYLTVGKPIRLVTQ